MEYPPCLNPSCKSRGQPHPNCQCYSDMAEGGTVSNYCDTNKPHKPDCQYFAEGGSTSSFDPDAFLAEPAPNGFDPDKFLAEPVSAEAKADAAKAHDEALQSKYGTAGQQVIAGLEAVGKGLAGPLATGAERLAGVNPEDIRGREEANPVTSIVGNVAGLVSPVGQGALLGKAGSLAAKGAERLVPQLVEKGILAGAAKGAVKLAAENALYQSGDEVSKMLVNDPNQSMSSAIANVGLATLLGAGAGSILGAANPLWKASVGEKASQMVTDFKTRMQEHLELPVDNTIHTISPETVAKDVYDPFTKTNIKIETTSQVSEPHPKYDPFTKEYVEGSRIDSKPIEDTLGGKLADMFIKHADGMAGKTLASAIGAVTGKMTHIPFGGQIGMVLGEKMLSPILESVLPAIGKPIMEKLSSAEGLKAATSYSMSVLKGIQLSENAIQNLFKSGTKILPDNKQPTEETRNKLQSSLDKYQKDPVKLSQIGGDLGHYMPNHAVAAGSTALNAVNLINSLKPEPHQKAPLDPVVEVSQATKSQYNRLLDIAQQPLTVIQSIKDNTITSHDVMAIQKLYPDLYNGLKQKMMNSIIDHTSKGETIPYDTRLGISIFMGQPMDSTMAPESILNAQPNSQQQPVQQDKPQKMTQGASNQMIKGSKGLQTQAQASEAMHSSGAKA